MSSNYNIFVLALFTFSILIILLVYAIHLYVLNGKLSKQKEYLKKLSADLNKKVLKREKESKDYKRRV